MKTCIIGADPIALFTGIQLKAVYPTREIFVVESTQRPTNSGVLLSGGLLNSERVFAPAVYAMIQRTAVFPGGITIAFKDQHIVCGGWHLTGISHSNLLQILAALNIPMLSEFPPLDPSDWIITTAPSLNTKSVQGHINVVVDTLIHSIRQTEYGTFVAHIYPISADEMSAVTIHCHDRAWYGSGLASADQPMVQSFFQSLFADDLHGEALTLTLPQPVAIFEHPNTTYLPASEPILGNQPLNERRPNLFFDEIDRFTHLDPEPFAFRLLTRANTETYDSLKLRDPDFIDRIERWFFERASTYYGPPLIAPPPLFSPLQMGKTPFHNRVIFAAPQVDDALDGIPSAAECDRMMRLALGRPALVISQPLAISAQSRLLSGSPGLYSDAQQSAWTTILQAVRGDSHAKVAAELIRVGDDAPSPEAFAAAAQRADAARFDVLVLNGVYGRFPIEIIDAVRAVWPKTKPLFVSLGLADEPIEEVISFATALRDHGCDCIQPIGLDTLVLCERIRAEVGICVIASGDITTTNHANSILAGGRADLILMDRHV